MSNKVSLIIPSYNNLRHLKNAYASLKKHAPEAEIVLLDDGSTDGTFNWIQQQEGCVKYRSNTRVGHTILYDKGIELASNDIVGIIHADMIIGPNYIQNMLKHLKPLTVVCGTRIEPPLHPEGKEKIIKDFGLDFDSLNINAFEEYCLEQQKSLKDKTTKGMFAPWMIYKEDFQSIGGHDPLFAPFPYEDSDIFQRWILKGYNLVQSRDAFVYHLTCRGHRWTEQVGKDDDYYKNVSNKASKNYLRKWGTWIENDEYQHPILHPRFDMGYVIHNCPYYLMELLEPLCDTIYTSDVLGINEAAYYEVEAKNTLFDLKKKFKLIGHDTYDNDIVVEFDANNFSNEAMNILSVLPMIINSNNDTGVFEFDIFKITVNKLTDHLYDLVSIDNPWYQEKLKKY